MKTYKFKIDGKDYCVTINGIEGKQADLTVNGVGYSVELENEVAAPAAPAAPAPVQAAPAQAAPAPAAPAKAPSGPAVTVHSPLPGVIISIDVKEGQAVKKGQKVAVLEAMKMENEIQAEADGTVTAILVQKGDSVLEGAEILKLA
ncbi:MAG: acetyl-CoA carboxylase biotin carboxyl carrier protein subunit [Bacteroidales bacterium]|nr:acetyl-CoA carboxylase biotin carboxyl carrier protein subunit [Bacteroidales bacterium]MBR0030550.1 acetyl-CoA carboxylase biotin carboxyl carrier protein subunit [Bacteroidales bacterium]MBR0290514.1 acetyl-CoA carboxylase biotin carboxyl carrier protein subunit [Bacteroidales bacterium]